MGCYVNVVQVLSSLYIFVLFSLWISRSCAGSIPDQVVGIFEDEACAPALAAKLAVRNHNAQSTDALQFKYKNLVKAKMENLTADDLPDFENVVYVTGHWRHCEDVAKLMESHSTSYLICYNNPTESIEAVLQSTQNLYLSQPNPKALVPTLVKLIDYLKRIRQSPCPAVFMLLDESHPYNQVESALTNNLSNAKMRFNITWLEDVERLSSQLIENHADLQIMIAFLLEDDARALLCELFQRKLFGSNIVLVFPGHFRSTWLDEDYYDNGGSSEDDSCEKSQLQAAAEGHFLLEYPRWNIDIDSDKTSELFVTKSELIRQLMNSTQHIRYDFDEAPLAYDSTWAMINAIRKSVDGNAVESDHGSGSGRGSFGEMVKRKLREPFIGLSGEFSLNADKVRSVNKATLIINRFAEGTYIQIGRHFNANSSLVWVGPSVLSDISKSSREQSLSDCQTPASTTPSPHSPPNTTSTGTTIPPDPTPPPPERESTLLLIVVIFVAVLLTLSVLLLVSICLYKRWLAIKR